MDISIVNHDPCNMGTRLLINIIRFTVRFGCIIALMGLKVVIFVDSAPSDLEWITLFPGLLLVPVVVMAHPPWRRTSMCLMIVVTIDGLMMIALNIALLAVNADCATNQNGGVCYVAMFVSLVALGSAAVSVMDSIAPNDLHIYVYLLASEDQLIAMWLMPHYCSKEGDAALMSTLTLLIYGHLAWRYLAYLLLLHWVQHLRLRLYRANGPEIVRLGLSDYLNQRGVLQQT